MPQAVHDISSVPHEAEELRARELQDLPVPIGRNYQELFTTLPGFTPLVIASASDLRLRKACTPR